VLVVDDSPLDRRLTTALLEKSSGARTLTAENGKQALEVMEKQVPTVVLTDLQMPEMDGLELTEEIRRRWPLVPVILMTANGSEEIAIRALQLGASSYVPKRLLDKELAYTVDQVLSTSQVDRRRTRVMECTAELDARLVLENDSKMVPAVVAHFQDYLIRMGLCDDHSKIRVGVALEEALLNAIYHGNLELSSDLRQDGTDTFQKLGEQRRDEEPYSGRRVHLMVRLRADEASFIVKDEGPGFDVASLPDPTDPENILKLSGRGLLLIRTFMDEVKHNERGNENTLVRRRRL
jgi:CheY-like chemotaxis protein/anti-sigma regulatory factor (Ser/Thr protein kinase)